MIKKSLILNNLFEIYYYYYYLMNLFNFIFLKNNKNFYYFLKFNYKYNFFLISKNKLNNFLNYNKLNKFLNYNINNKINNHVKFFNDNKIIKNIFFLKKNSSLEYKLFNLYFLFNYSLFNTYFKYHHNFKLFYIYNKINKTILLDSTKFLLRWKESYDFFFNIFFYNFIPLIFGTNFFKNEILALNWNYGIFDINIWKLYFPFFTFKINNYNKKTDFFFDKLSSLNVNFFLISDCQYHFKNIHYIKKKNHYSIGLININIDPWLVNYPIISFFENFLTQLFFFKFLIFIEKRNIFIKYNIFKNLFLNFFLNKNYLLK